jgi:thiamine-monophosphate kinase
VDRSEDAWIAAVAKRFPASGRVLVGIGDDVAAVRLGGRVAVLKTDTIVDGVDVRLSECGPEAAGRKAVAVCASDLAAAGALPTAVVASVTLPRGASFESFEAISAGIARGARECGADVVGGDTGVADGPLVVAIAMLGEPGAMGVLTRRGARPGDALSVTGPLGGSILGRHLSFRPRLDASGALVERGIPHAMMDLSDGLLADLPRLARASGCGADVEAERVPIHDDARRLPGGGDALAHALGDGEDFELLVAHEALSEERERDLAAAGVALVRIGTVTPAASGLRLLVGGSPRPLPAGGYDHLRGG